jgi:hypothetical protein
MCMSWLARIPHLATSPSHRPWQRAIVDEAGWLRAIDHLAPGELTLLGLWGEPGAVHMALFGEANECAVLSLECASGKFPSVSVRHLPAVRLERTIRDLFGLEAVGATDTRPWLDHETWGERAPLGKKAAGHDAGPYQFLPAEGEALHQVAVGPVHAGIIEPGHFRFNANGEHVVRLEQRLGYAHKCIESLMRGASLEVAAKLAGRTSGDSTVAYALAFARAAEAAQQLKVPPRGKGF